MKMGLKEHKRLVSLTAVIFGMFIFGQILRMTGTTNKSRVFVEEPLYDEKKLTNFSPERRLRVRREMMLQACAKYDKEKKLPADVAYLRNPFLKTSLFFSDKYKVLFCQILKCGTRSQAKFLAAADGLIDQNEIDTVTEIRATSLIEKHLSARNAKNIEEIARRIETYAKVVIVREPFSRLLSAFRNKLENNKRHDGYAAAARNMHTKYGKGRGEESDGAPVITLDDFISHLIDPKSNAQVDQHWNFYHRLCSPCELQYDYVIHMDTIDDDMRFIVNKFGFKNLTFPPSFDSFTDYAKVQKYFSKASPKLVKSLYDTYLKDFHLFGFPPALDMIEME